MPHIPDKLRHQLDLLQAHKELAAVTRSVTRAEWMEIANGIGEVIFSTPPGVDRADHLRGLVERLDAGTATYEDRIIVDACRLDVLRILLRIQRLAPLARP